MTKRIATPDLLKGLAVIFMIQVHITEVFAEQYVFDSIWGKISLFLGGPPAAPLFMAIMGYFVFISKKDLQDSVTRGLLLIGGGIFLNAALNFNLLYNIFTGVKEADPYKFLLGVDILPLAGLSIIILSVMKHYFGQNLYPFIISALVTLFLTPIFNNSFFLPPFLQAFIGGKIGWSYFPLLPWFIYPLLGYIFAAKKDFILSINIKISVLSITITAALLLATASLAIPNIYDLEKYYHHEYFLVLWITGFLLIFIYAADKIEKAAGNNLISRYIKWIGENVTAFYVVQWVLVGNIGTSIYKSTGFKESAAWFVIILITATAVVYIYNKLKLLLSTDPKLQEHTL